MNKHSHPNEAEGLNSSALHPSAPLVAQQDPIWRAVRDDALAAVDRDPATAPMFDVLVLRHTRLEDAVIAVLCSRLADAFWADQALCKLLHQALDKNPDILQHLAADMQAVYDRDPACYRYVEPLLYFKGFQALQTQRFSHALWNDGRRDMALYLQSRMSAVFQVDINPASRLGGGIFFDHATGIVIGETAVIDDNVSIMQNVTLGGTGKEGGDRHPKVEGGVLVGSGAKVLGNITLGQGSRVAASSVVLDSVPPLATVAGIPAKIVSMAKPKGPDCMPSLSMDQTVPHQRHVDSGSGI
ncbi:MAG: serine O-acetyltransferase [Pseudomonadota bacterium]